MWWPLRKRNRELDREIRGHLDLEKQERIDSGDSPEVAHHAARKAFGSVAYAQEATRATWGWSWLERLGQDLRYAARGLSRSPGFAAAAVLTLALGIGANTAIFSLVEAVLLRLLPVQNPQELVALTLLSQRGLQNSSSYPFFLHLRDHTSVFAGVFAAGWDPVPANLVVAGGQTEKTQVHRVSGEYFDVLGVRAIAGRTLGPEDNQAPGASSVAVLSYGFWRRRFGGDTPVVGKSIAINGFGFTIAGVASPGFFGESVGRAPDLWVPLVAQPALDGGVSNLGRPNVGWLRIMARLKPGVDERKAEAQLAVILDRLRSDQSPLGGSAYRIGLDSGSRGMADFRNRYEQPLRILMVAVGLVLLIACSNVANLLLARATARQREIAIRLAIGAGRGRLTRQFLTESVALACLGGALGVVFAWWGSLGLLRLVSGGPAPVTIDVTPNARILGFTILTTLLTGLLFGLAPAISAARQDVNSALKLTRSSRSRFSLSRTLVIAQIALSLLLLTGAGLLVRTLNNLRTLDLGFSGARILQTQFNARTSGYAPEQIPALERRVIEALRATPGVLSASLSTYGFRTGLSETCCISPEGYTHKAGEERQITTLSVMPGFFATMGLPLLLGRDFTAEEVTRSRGPGSVAIISEAMARYYFGGANPVGRRMGWGDPPRVKYEIEIIGVARDAIYSNLRERPRRVMYSPSEGGDVVLVRAAGDLPAMVSAIRARIQAIDPNLRVTGPTPIPELVDQVLAREKLLAKLSGIFGGVALLLAAVGLYGLMAYGVARRTQEIGIRMALGARRNQVRWLVVRQTIVLVVIGVLIGAPAALVARRLIEAQLFGVPATDAVTLTSACAVMLVVAALAGYLPARRAARVDPTVALRYE